MFPFPGIPYGVAPWWCFPLNEVCMYALMAVCFVHAVKSGKRTVAYLLGGLVFGLILEYLEVLSGSYTYGRFFIMLGRAPVEIPLCIGCGWAIILYSARLFSDAYKLPLLAAAALDTLLALNIDLSMDVVAYRLHMWHWYWSVPVKTHLHHNGSVYPTAISSVGSPWYFATRSSAGCLKGSGRRVMRDGCV